MKNKQLLIQSLLPSVATGVRKRFRSLRGRGGEGSFMKRPDMLLGVVSGGIPQGIFAPMPILALSVAASIRKGFSSPEELLYNLLGDASIGVFPNIAVLRMDVSQRRKSIRDNVER